jgi:hypothetical protein
MAANRSIAGSARMCGMLIQGLLPTRLAVTFGWRRALPLRFPKIVHDLPPCAACRRRGFSFCPRSALSALLIGRDAISIRDLGWFSRAASNLQK